MKPKEEIQKRVNELKTKEKHAANELKQCDPSFLDINITRANFMQHERQILEWVLG